MCSESEEGVEMGSWADGHGMTWIHWSNGCFKPACYSCYLCPDFQQNPMRLQLTECLKSANNAISGAANLCARPAASE